MTETPVDVANVNDDDDDDDDHRQALEAELSGDFETALKIYKKLMDQYDTRYEKEEHVDSQNSSRCMDEEHSGGGKENGEHKIFP